jgi:hypothetical protein
MQALGYATNGYGDGAALIVELLAVRRPPTIGRRVVPGGIKPIQ